MASLGDLEIDVVSQDQSTYSNTVTEKPVENQENIADHVIHDPIPLNLKCYFSGNEANRKHEELKSMRDSDETYTYKGSSGTFKNMVITEVSILKEAQYGNGFECNIALKQVRTASLQTVITQYGKSEEGSEEEKQVQGESKETKEKSKESETKNEESVDETTLEILREKASQYIDSLNEGSGGE